MIPMAEFDALVELDEGELIIMTRPQTFHHHIAGNFLSEAFWGRLGF